MEKRIQTPNLSQAMIDQLVVKGFDVCYVAYYSTKPVDVLVGVVEEATKVHLGPDGMVDLVNFPEQLGVLRPAIQAHFVGGEYTFLADEEPRPMLGSYLRILCPIRNWKAEETTDDERAAILAVENCAALISLMHGELVTLEMHYAAVVVLSRGQSITTSNETYVRQTLADEHLNQDMARIIDEVRDCDFSSNETAMLLLRRAHKEKDNSVKFLFMWMALEAILGDGGKRKRFALEVMKSEKLNASLNELREVRNALVHDGELVHLTHKVYLKIKTICIMGLANNPTIRRQLLDYIIDVLSLEGDAELSDQAPEATSG